MPKYWRPLTQDELPYLAGGDTLTLRLNYLYNPDKLPVTYGTALCIERRKRDGTFLVEGTDTPIEISLSEAGRYAHDGWYMTGEELSKVKLNDPVRIHDDSGGFRMARFRTGASPHTAKVIFEGETEESSVLVRQIGPANGRPEEDEWLRSLRRKNDQHSVRAPKSGLQAQGLLASFDKNATELSPVVSRQVGPVE